MTTWIISKVRDALIGKSQDTLKPNRYKYGRTAIIESPAWGFKEKVERMHAWKLALYVIAMMFVLSGLRALVLAVARADMTGPRATILEETFNARMFTASVLGVAAAMAVQQAMRGVTQARTATQARMRERTLEHIRETMAEFRVLENTLMDEVLKKIPDEVEEDDGFDAYPRNGEERGIGLAEALHEEVAKVLKDDPGLRTIARTMLSSLEQLAVGVARGVYGFVIVDITVGAIYIDTWARWCEFAVQRRHDVPTQHKAYDQIQWLAGLLVRWRLLDPNTKGQTRDDLMALLDRTSNVDGKTHKLFDVHYNPAYVIRHDSALHHLVSIVCDEAAFESAIQAAAEKPEYGMCDSIVGETHRVAK